ncbi:MAG: TetR/AcrR family transcriptional regulator [Magnetococcales bacterium]|nr:TetR/AcrR family transcriptional regulator [Magnetococcales bacterium]
MARRSDHSREELYEMALDAAREIVLEVGVRGLTTRKVASRIGYSVGTLYNLFENLDDMIVHLNGRILDELHDWLVEDFRQGEPEFSLYALVESYLKFTRKNRTLWNVLFEYRFPEDQELPVWYQEKINRLLRVIERSITPLFTPDREQDRQHAAYVLWCGLHGICALSSTDKLGIVSSKSISEMAGSLITNYLAGIRSRMQPVGAAV